MFERKKTKSGRKVHMAQITEYSVSDDVAALEHLYTQIQRNETIVKESQLLIQATYQRSPLKKIIKQHQKNLKAEMPLLDALQANFRTQCQVQGHPLYLIRVYKTYRDALNEHVQKIKAESQQIDLLCAAHLESLQSEIKAQRYRVTAKHMRPYYQSQHHEMIHSAQRKLDGELKQASALRYKKILAVYHADLKDKAILIAEINAHYQSSLENIRDEWILLKNKLETHSHNVVRSEVEVQALHHDIQSMQARLVRDYPFVESQIDKPAGYPAIIYDMATILYQRIDDSAYTKKYNAKDAAAIFYAGHIQDMHQSFAQTYQALTYLNQSSFQDKQAALIRKMNTWRRILQDGTRGEVNWNQYPVVSDSLVTQPTVENWVKLSEQEAQFRQAQLDDARELFERERANAEYTQNVQRFVDAIAQQIQLLIQENNPDKQPIVSVLTNLHQRLHTLNHSYIKTVFGVEVRKAQHEYINNVKSILFEELEQKRGWKKIAAADETGQVTKWLRGLLEPFIRWLSCKVTSSYGGFFAGSTEKVVALAESSLRGALFATKQ